MRQPRLPCADRATVRSQRHRFRRKLHAALLSTKWPCLTRAIPPEPRRIQVHCCLSSQPPMPPRARASRALDAPRLRCASRALHAPRLRHGVHTAPPPIHPPVQVYRYLSSRPPTLPRRSFPLLVRGVLRNSPSLYGQLSSPALLRNSPAEHGSKRLSCPAALRLIARSAPAEHLVHPGCAVTPAARW